MEKFKEKIESERLFKKTMIEASQRFNISPKDGIRFLTSVGILNESNYNQVSNDKQLTLAQFFKCSGNDEYLDKKVLGEFLAKPANKITYSQFIDGMKMKGKSIDVCLRMLLETFRLPGEAPLITEILETFASKFYATSPG